MEARKEEASGRLCWNLHGRFNSLAPRSRLRTSRASDHFPVPVDDLQSRCRLKDVSEDPTQKSEALRTEPRRIFLPCSRSQEDAQRMAELRREKQVRSNFEAANQSDVYGTPT